MGCNLIEITKQFATEVGERKNLKITKAHVDNLSFQRSILYTIEYKYVNQREIVTGRMLHHNY